MNIFVLDLNHTLNAQYHVNSHVVKMPTEAAQMLSTVVRLSGIDAGYKITHQHHPCTKWAAASLDNWLWLRNYGLALEQEWRYRFDHTDNATHKSCDVIRSLPVPNLPMIGLTPFAQAMDSQYKNEQAVIAYRNFYRSAKRHLAVWGKRGRPVWYGYLKPAVSETASTNTYS